MTKQPFRNIDVLDDKFKARITKRSDLDAAARMPGVVTGEWAEWHVQLS